MRNYSIPPRPVMAAILSALLSAGTTNPGRAADEPSDNMKDLMRATLTMGARHLIDQIETTNNWTWLLQPGQVRYGSVHVKNVTNYYSYKMVDQNVYKHEKRTVYYEVYESKVLKPSSSPGDPPKVVTVKKQRRINSPAEAKNPRYVQKRTVNVRVGKPVGTKKVKRLVRDPNGSIEKVHRVQKPGIADYWPTGFLGQNAMALLALLKCGIPEDDEDVFKLAETLNGAVLGYNAPDTTVDLAWLAAAFANLKGHQFERTREILISKVADGQIKDGNCRGLWGPVCVNTEMLGRALAYQQTVSKRFVDARGRKKRGEQNEKAVEDLEYIAEICKRVSQQGMRFADIKKHYVLGMNDYVGDTDVIIEGLPWNIYKHTVADMESTGLALYALREAAANEVLPEKTWRPKTKRGSAFRWPAAEPVSAVLARAASAISRLADRGAKWPECNLYQVCKDFTRVPIPPLDSKPPGLLPNPENTISSMRACTALLDIGHAVGMEKMVGKFGPALAAAHKKRHETVDRYLTQSPVLRTSGYCNFLPAELYFKSTGLQKHYLSTGTVDPKLWKRLVVHVSREQETNGSWTNSLPERYLVKTTAEWHAAELWTRAWIDKYVAELKKKGRHSPRHWPERPAGSDEFWELWIKGRWHLHPQFWRPFTDTVAPTAYAMLFLSEGGRPPPPVRYIDHKKEEQPPRILSTAAHLLLKSKKATVHYAGADPSNAADIEKAPMAFLGLKPPMDDEKITASLKKAFEAGMMLVVDGAKARDPKLILKLTDLSGGKFGPLPENNPALEGIPVTKLGMEGIVRPDGTIAVLLLPWRGGTRLPRGVLTGNQALQITQLVLAHEIGKQKSEGEMVIDPNASEDMAVLKTSALVALGGGVRRPPPAPTKEPAKADTPPAAGKKEQAAPPPEPVRQLKEDEVW